mmetsp:Transcript_20023/g.23052  ORF Transcript_20023/g.23052 Transcript_20023/m.23052 type:complete len:233 (-) Transcript_20023:952-1650(-)
MFEGSPSLTFTFLFFVLSWLPMFLFFFFNSFVLDILLCVFHVFFLFWMIGCETFFGCHSASVCFFLRFSPPLKIFFSGICLFCVFVFLRVLQCCPVQERGLVVTEVSTLSHKKYSGAQCGALACRVEESGGREIHFHHLTPQTAACRFLIPHVRLCLRNALVSLLRHACAIGHKHLARHQELTLLLALGWLRCLPLRLTLLLLWCLALHRVHVLLHRQLLALSRRCAFRNHQ